MNISHRRIVAIMVAPVLALALQASPQARHAVMAAEPETTCKKPKISVLIDNFRHEDGTASAWSEWMIVNPLTVVHQAGINIQGRMLRDMTGFNENLDYFLEGAPLIEDNLTITCVPNPGTEHSKTPPPQLCPTTADDAVNQIGGYQVNWQPSESQYFWILTYLEVPGQTLPTFTVPLQGLVTVEQRNGRGLSFTPGYRVPASGSLTLECSKAVLPEDLPLESELQPQPSPIAP